MRIASVLAGFSLGQADMLRKAMGKKDPKVMAKQREAFMAGARTKGVNEKKATKIFDLMEYFAGYGFNKSHSTAYAFLAYQTAYLKANYPRHFAAALLTIEAANTDKLALYITECRERGIAVLPPDVNESQLHFTVVPEGVRFGLTAIKGLGEGAIQSMLEVRAATRPHHLAAPAVRGARSAARQQAGARSARQVRRLRQRWSRQGVRLTGRAAPCCSAPWTAPSSTAAACSGTAISGQADLFGGGDDGGLSIIRLPDTPPWTEMELLGYEKEALGLYLSGHPIDRHADDLRPVRRPYRGRPHPGRPAALHRRHRRAASRSRTSTSAASSRALRPLKTKKGDAMCVFALEDYQGTVEVVVFPETYAPLPGRLRERRAAAGAGQVRTGRGVVQRCQATEMLPLAQLRERLSRGVRIRSEGRHPA